MTDKDFDKRIGDKLRGYGEQPPHDMFSRIEKTLGGAAETPVVASTGKRRTIVYVYRFAVAAAILFGVVFFVSRQNRPVEETPSVANAAEDIIRSVGTEKIDPANILPENSVTPENDIAGAIRKMIADDAKVRKSDNTEKATGKALPDADKIIAALRNDPRPSMELQQTPPAGQKGFAEAAESTQARRRYEQDRRNKNIENYWGDMFREIELEEASKRSRNFSASMYASNFGVGSGDISSNDMSKLAASNMLIKETSISIPGHAAGVSSSYEGEIPALIPPLDLFDDNVTLRHRMPISAGITVAFPISRRVSIVSGVNYSYLYSSATQTLRTGYEGKIINEQHYIGIPIGVIYSIYDNRWIDVYVRAGGMIEKSVYAVRKVDYAENADVDIQRVKVAGVQTSLDAAAGANFRLGKGIGLYVEPGVAYYFERPGQLSSYRTENPTNFMLRVGVRFDIK